jgi:hypothetical protein
MRQVRAIVGGKISDSRSESSGCIGAVLLLYIIYLKNKMKMKNFITDTAQ